MIQSDAAFVEGYPFGGFPEKLAVGVVGHLLGGPVKAVFVVALIGAEADSVEVVKYLTFDGRVDYEEKRGFVRLDVVSREELDVDFLGVIEVLRIMLAGA